VGHRRWHLNQEEVMTIAAVAQYHAGPDLRSHQYPDTPAHKKKGRLAQGGPAESEPMTVRNGPGPGRRGEEEEVLGRKCT
jgi:hypothetical protein